MATLFDYFRLFSFSSRQDGNQTLDDFVPLSTDQMHRLQGGFDLDDVPAEEENDETDIEPVEAPISGELADDTSGS